MYIMHIFDMNVYFSSLTRTKFSSHFQIAQELTSGEMLFVNNKTKWKIRKFQGRMWHDYSLDLPVYCIFPRITM